jgi:hypothetical protein
MNLKEALVLLEGTLLTPECDLGLEFTRVFASDLMSDVLAFMEAGTLLITGLVNPHVVLTAGLAEAAAVVFVQGKRPSAQVLDQALVQKLPLLLTPLPMFEACARMGAERAR